MKMRLEFEKMEVETGVALNLCNIVSINLPLRTSEIAQQKLQQHQRQQRHSVYTNGYYEFKSVEL